MWIFTVKTQFNRYLGWYRSASFNTKNCSFISAHSIQWHTEVQTFVSSS